MGPQPLCTGLWPARPCAGGLRSGIVKLGARIARTSSDCESPPDVPTLFRFLAFIGIIAGLIFGGMIALVTFVQPVQREMIEIVPPSKLQPK
jgi:hypothetical protein